MYLYSDLKTNTLLGYKCFIFSPVCMRPKLIIENVNKYISWCIVILFNHIYICSGNSLYSALQNKAGQYCYNAIQDNSNPIQHFFFVHIQSVEQYEYDTLEETSMQEDWV